MALPNKKRESQLTRHNFSESGVQEGIQMNNHTQAFPSICSILLRVQWLLCQVGAASDTWLSGELGGAGLLVLLISPEPRQLRVRLVEVRSSTRTLGNWFQT